MLPSYLSKDLTKKQLNFLNDFFSGCNTSFFQHLIIKTFKKNHLLIDTDDPCTYVYILLSGRLQAIEEQVVNEPYHFTELSAIEIVGDFELFVNAPTRAITLRTLEESKILIIPSSLYFSWIRQDSHGLFIRLQMLVKHVMIQGQADRLNFFMDNQTRMIYFLIQECKKQQPNFPFKLHYTRQMLSFRLGCSIRTINRIIQQLELQGLLTLVHGKITITHSQFQLLNDKFEHF